MSDSNLMREKILEVFEDILDIDPEDIADNFSPDDSTSWDSMNNLRLVTALEEEFNTRLTMEDIERMINFGKIYEVINSYTSSKP